MLRDLMDRNGLKAADLAPELGSRARVSEVLSGKRSISKEQAKKLLCAFIALCSRLSFDVPIYADDLRRR